MFGPQKIQKMGFLRFFAGYSGPFELKIGFSEAYRCSLHMFEIFLKKKKFTAFLSPLKTEKMP